VKIKPQNCIIFGDEMNVDTLRMRWHRLDVLFLNQVYSGSKFCPSVLEIVGLRVPARYLRDFALFNVCSLCENCPSASCASAANVVCRDVDVFGARNVLLNHFYVIIVNTIIIYMYMYCDMSTHCWVAQLVSRHRPVNKVARRRDDVTCLRGCQ
jgi:hypothetical protein